MNPTLEQIAAATNVATRMNELFDAVSVAGAYGKRHAVTTGLTWGYYGSIYNTVTVADGTVALTDNATNYIVAHRTTGAVSASTATTNWNTVATYAKLYKVTTASGLVTDEEDHRLDTGGLFNSTSITSPVGLHAVYVAAAAMAPSVSGGCAAITTIASASNQPDITTLDFDQTTEEYAQFSVVMPKSWNEGTVTFKAHWSHASSTGDVIWGLQAVAVSNDDAIAVAFGTAQEVTDTGGTVNDLYTSPESSAITVAGTPAAEDMVFFRLYRKSAAGGDTLSADGRLHGITLYITTDAATDA